MGRGDVVEVRPPIVDDCGRSEVNGRRSDCTTPSGSRGRGKTVRNPPLDIIDPTSLVGDRRFIFMIPDLRIDGKEGRQRARRGDVRTSKRVTTSNERTSIEERR